MVSRPRTRRWQSDLLSAGVVAWALLLCAVRCTCEPVDLTGAPFACGSDSDCIEGFVCGAESLCTPPVGAPDAGTGPDAGDAGDAGCVPTSATEQVCFGGIDEDCDGMSDCGDPDCEDQLCSTGGAFACSAGGCVCAVNDVEIATGSNAGGNVVRFDGRLSWIIGGESGDILYGECEGNCEAPSTRVLESPSYPRQRPSMKLGGTGLIAAWRRGNGVLGFAECAGGCMDSGFERVGIGGLQIGAMPVHVAAEGNRRAIVAMDQTGRVLWVECPGQCDTAAQWSSQVLSPAGAPKGLAALLWQEDGGTGRMTAFGGPLRARSCTGACAAASAWSPALTLDSDSFQPELRRTDSGRVALFARSEALKKLFAFGCAAGSDCSIPQSWAPAVAWSFPADTRDYHSSVTPDGGLAFVTSVPAHLVAGVETNGAFVTAPLPLCDGGTVSGYEPAGFVDARGRWTVLYHSRSGGTRLYLPRQ